MGVGHMHRRALVANVDDGDAGAGGAVPDRLDVAALQPEDSIDATRLESPYDPGRHTFGVRVQVEPRRARCRDVHCASLLGVDAARSGVPCAAISARTSR